MAQRKQGETSQYYYVVDGAPADASGDDVSALGDVEDEEYVGLPRIFATQQPEVGELSNDNDYGATVTAYIPLKDAEGHMIGILGADLDAAEVYKLLQQTKVRMLFVAIGILALTLIVIGITAGYLVRPLRKLTTEIQHVQTGNLTVDVEVHGTDEVGRLSAAFRSMVLDLRSMIGGIQSSADLLRKASNELSVSAEQTSTSSIGIAVHMKDSAGETAQQVTRMDEVTQAIDEVSAGVQRVADFSTAVADSSERMTVEAQRGNSSVYEVSRQMELIHSTTNGLAEHVRNLAERSIEVASIVDVIGGIAAQTNLLALNAAIEAARAGEHGRGFAVVADQVRKLAVQSAESADRIQQMIGGIVQDTELVVHSMETGQMEAEAGRTIVQEASTAFTQIMVEVKQVAEQIHDVSVISQQMAAGSEEIAASVGEVTLIAHQTAQRHHQIAAGAEDTLVTVQQMSTATESLNRMAEQLIVMTAKFKI
jgi:methyl-accepting chemotaxis protein